MKSVVLFIVSIFVVFLYEVKGQEVSTRISGKFDKTFGRYLITLSKPVGGFYSAENIDISDSIILQDEKFEVNYNLQPHSFVTLYFAHHYVMSFYADSASDIKFEILTDSAQNPGRIFFFGDNAAANELIANHELLIPYGVRKKEIEKIIIEATNAQIAINQLQSELKKYKDYLNELLTRQKISRACYEAFTAEVEQRLLFCCKDVFWQNAVGTTQVAMSKSEIKILANYLFTSFDPFDKRNFPATCTLDNIAAKCILINYKIIPRVITTPKDTWKNFAHLFNFLAPYMGVYDLAPNSVQLYLAGNALLKCITYQSLTRDEFMSVYTTYKKLYPASPYNQIIEKHLPDNPFSKSSSIIRPSISTH
jgi:hypothetical protein